MRITEAIDIIDDARGRLCAHRPNADFALFFDPKFDPSGQTLVLFWAKRIPTTDESMAGAGFGIPLFSLADIRADDWEILTLEEAAEFYDTRR
jgi:hypothetical protein